MELLIKDRLYIPSILKEQNKNFLEYSVKRSIMSKIGITVEDKEKYKIEDDAETKSIKWDAKIDKENPLNVEFTESELNYLKESCESVAEAPYPDDFWQCVEKIYNAAN